MKKLEKRIAELEARVLDLEAFAGVLVPVFDKQYKKQGYDFSQPGALEVLSGRVPTGVRRARK